MATISPHLRNFKEPTKDQLTQLFFALPSSSGSVNGSDSGAANGSPSPSGPSGKGEKNASTSPQETELEKMEINAVLSLGVQGEEDSYVSASFVHAVVVRPGCDGWRHFGTFHLSVK